MEEDSVENSIQGKSSKEIELEGEADIQSMQRMIEGDQQAEQPIQISEQLQVKFSQTFGRFTEQMKTFRQSQKNVFVIENPHQYQLFHITKIWKHRPNKNQKFLLNLQVVNPNIPISVVTLLFEPFPSINVYYGDKKIENNGLLLTEGEYFYEGNERCMNIYSESRETDYEGQVSNREPHGRGVLIYRAKKGGYMYRGTFLEGKYHGTGELRNSKNVIYMGEFKNDFKDGRGVQMTMRRKKNQGKGEPNLARKSMYNGDFKEGYRCGQGIEETPHAVYKGSWKDGVKCGYGEIIYKNGDSYKGEWENNEFSGEGTYIQKGNCTYTGTFKEGKYNGKGVMQYENGDKYIGDYEKKKKHGTGIYTWADGDYYDGEWKNDSAEGHGTSMIGTDFYDGEFKNGRRHGQGELINEDGDIVRALWENNEIKKELERNGEKVE